MFVYSAISCEEILVLPIFRACVSTWRYRDRRAATPTFKRSATRPPFFWLYFVTALSVVPACLRLRLCNRLPQRIRVDEVRESPPPIDLHDRDPLAVFSFEPGVSIDRDLPERKAELVARSRDHPPRRLAEVATRGGVQHDLRHSPSVRPDNEENPVRVGKPWFPAFLWVDAPRDRSLGDALHRETVGRDAHR